MKERKFAMEERDLQSRERLAADEERVAQRTIRAELREQAGEYQHEQSRGFSS